MLETRLADELTTHVANAVGAVVNPVKCLFNLLESLVLLAHLTEVLKAHEAVASILVLSGAVDRLLQRIGLQRSRLADDGLTERHQRLAELGEIGIGELQRLLSAGT